jgi:transcriptional regulator with XRE-family HTH domain
MMKQSTLRSRLRDARPDIAERASGNEMKRKLALALRALRKSRGMTQRDVEARSGMTQSMISRLEAPAGALPNWETVLRYVEACDGHMLLGFSLDAFDEAKVVGHEAGEGGRVNLVSAVAA